MSNADLIAEALTVLFTITRAATLWILAALAIVTLAALGLVALLVRLANLIRDSNQT